MSGTGMPPGWWQDKKGGWHAPGDPRSAAAPSPSGAEGSTTPGLPSSSSQTAGPRLVASGSDAAKSHRFCPQCGTQAVPGSAICSHCGQSLSGDGSRFCLRCGTQAVQGNAFCGLCGNPLSGDSGGLGSETIQSDTDSGVLRSDKRMSPIRWAIVVGLLTCAVGLVLPWYASLLLSVTGINTGDGQFFAGVLGAAALVGWWRLLRTNRVNGALLFLLWVGMFAMTIYEMVNVSTIFTASTLGSGLYVCAIGSALGTVAIVLDMSRTWTKDSVGVGSPPVWLPLMAGVVVVLALGGAAFGGHQHGTNVATSLDDILHSGGSNVSSLGNSHSSPNSVPSNSNHRGSGIAGSGATAAPAGGLSFTFTVSQQNWSQIVALVNSTNPNLIYHYTSGEDFLRANLCQDADEGPGSSDASGFLAPTPVEVGTSGGGVVFRVTLSAGQVAASDHQLELNKCSSQSNAGGAPESTIEQDYTNSNSDFEINWNISGDGGNSSELGSNNSGSGTSGSSGSTGSSGDSGAGNSGNTGNT